MNREQFFGQLVTFDEQRLKKALWNLYWRGSAATRERIEAEIDPDQHAGGKRRSKEPADPQQLLGEVRGFVALARSGAYMAGDRRVSPRERTRWRFTFQRLVTDTQDALRAADVGAAAAAVEQLIDLACELRDYDYFRSQDPLEAARFVVSDAAALLWGDKSMFGDVRPLARQYGRLAGEDPDVARAEVLRIVRQLLPLDARMRPAGELPRQVTRAEFELAAGALLRFYVSGRQTDDPLLPEVQAAFGEVDATSEAILDRTRGGDGSSSVQRKQHREQHAAANLRYVEAWLRWLDHQAGQPS